MYGKLSLGPASPIDQRQNAPRRNAVETEINEECATIILCSSEFPTLEKGRKILQKKKSCSVALNDIRAKKHQTLPEETSLTT